MPRTRAGPTARNVISPSSRHQAAAFDRDKSQRAHSRSDPAAVARGFRQPNQIEEAMGAYGLQVHAELPPPSHEGDRHHAQQVQLALDEVFRASAWEPPFVGRSSSFFPVDPPAVIVTSHWLRLVKKWRMPSAGAPRPVQRCEGCSDRAAGSPPSHRATDNV